MINQKKVLPQDLICMDDKAHECHYRIDLAYAKNDNLLFGECIYRDEARLWLHKDLAQIVFHAAKHCFEIYNLHFILYDGLRTIEAQQAMMKTQRVRDNPHWLETPKLLSPPGTGGHPRGMAIDIGLEDGNGILVDMGTEFDYLASNPHLNHNPAHRDYAHAQEIIDNRKILNDCMIHAANKLSIPILLLSQEWWDFRLPPEVYEQYAPLHDFDLPEKMRCICNCD